MYQISEYHRILERDFFDGRLKLWGKGGQNGKIIAEESKSIYFLHSQWPSSKFCSMLTVPKSYLKD